MDDEEYVGSEQWDKDAKNASDKFRVTKTSVCETGIGLNLARLEAEAGTGSRYEVVAAPVLDKSEGDVLLVVTQPWQAQTYWSIEADMDLYDAWCYLKPRAKNADSVNGGDLQAVMMLAVQAMEQMQ